MFVPPVPTASITTYSSEAELPPVAILLIRRALVLAARVSVGGRIVSAKIVAPRVAARRVFALAIRSLRGGLGEGEGAKPPTRCVPLASRMSR